MKVERKEKVILMVPYPAQGHVTPMVNLSSSLPALGYRPIMVLPEFLLRQIEAKGDEHHMIMSIPDGVLGDGPRGFFEIEKAMESVMPAHLERIVRRVQDKGDAVVACLVVDLLASSAFEVARRCGVPAAGFWPATFATYRLIAAIPRIIRAGFIDRTGIPMQHGQISLEQDLPTINTQDLPWLIGSLIERQSKFKFWVRTINRARSLQWLLVNSFPDEVKTSKSYHQEGPTIYPIALLKKQQQIHKPSPTLTFWAEDEACMGWLDEQKPNTVVYASFGTWFSPTNKSEVKALASSLEAMGRPFLWALGPKWADGLPVGFQERVADRGKVVAWAPQVQVLHHKAVACFLTHCGWNSITEAIRANKCLVCSPLAGDQLLNCVYVVDVWKIGVRIEGFGAREMGVDVSRLINDTEMKKRIVKLNESFMGEEARFKMMANIVKFLSNINKLAN